MLLKRHETGGAENKIKIEILQIIFSEAKMSTEGKEFVRLVPHLFFCALVTGRHTATGSKQHGNQRLIAHPDANHTD